MQSFPKDFLWGVASSAHQVEGNTHNQWTEWELKNANSLAKAAKHRLAHLDSWPRIKAEASDAQNYVSGQATDHYHLYEKDFAIAKAMKLTAYRFSIEWSRIEPREGVWDAAEIAHYRRYIATMRHRGLEPIVTLYHWTVPVWFDQKGGFERASNIHYFVRFAEKVLTELGSELVYIATINEPDTVTGAGYITCEHPPQRHSYRKAFWVYRNLLLAHRRVYRMAKQISPRYQVGMVKSYAYVYAGDASWQSRVGVWLDYLLRDDLVLWYIGRHKDFLGVNYYFSDRHVGFRTANEDDTVSDLGWELKPQNLEFVLGRLSRRHPRTPLIVTETGLADSRDEQRSWWIAHTVQAVQRAMDAGAMVRGYMVWSLTDTVEWAYGTWPRFGMVAIDYRTKARTPRKSARLYAKIVATMRGLAPAPRPPKNTHK